MAPPLDRQQQGQSQRVPEEVKRRVGGALWDAQIGLKAPFAKPPRGFGSAGTLEIIDDFNGDSYRAVYTVRFAGVGHVLHAFQKRSKKGIATLRRDVDLVKARLKTAKEDYGQWREGKHPQ